MWPQASHRRSPLPLPSLCVQMIGRAAALELGMDTSSYPAYSNGEML